MGDIAEMMLEGLLDEETGEYIGDINEGVYGMSAPGFPVSYERQLREGELVHECRKKKASPNKIPCKHCGKLVSRQGMQQHILAKHSKIPIAAQSRKRRLNRILEIVIQGEVTEVDLREIESLARGQKV